MTNQQLMDHGNHMMDETDQAIERSKKVRLFILDDLQCNLRSQLSPTFNKDKELETSLRISREDLNLLYRWCFSFSTLLILFERGLGKI